MAVRDEYAGRSGKCVCGAVIKVPLLAQATATNATSARSHFRDSVSDDDSATDKRVPTVRVKPWRWIAGGATAVLILLIAVIPIFKGSGQSREQTSAVPSTRVPQSRVEEQQTARAREEAAKAEAASLAVERQREKTAAGQRLAEQRQREEKERQIRAEKVRLASMAVEREWGRLPKDYAGNDPKMLYQELSKRLSGLESTDQFDTADQHRAKVQEALRGPMLGSLTISSLYAFIIEQYMSYDAERGMYDCVVYDWSPIELATLDFIRGDSYVGENAFGVKKEVRVSTSEVLQLKLTNARDFDRIRFSMPSQQAREAQDKLRLLLIGKLQAPYLIYEKKEHLPTIDSPRRSTTIGHTIPFELHEIWVVRNDNGQIVHRFAPWVADPEAVMQKAARRLAKESLFERVQFDVRKTGNSFTATLMFTRTLTGNYAVTYSWRNGKWVLTGGTFNKPEHDNTTKRIPLRASYGYYEDDAVPHEVEDAFSSAYSLPNLD